MVAEWNQPAGWLHGSPFQMSQDSGFACRVLRSSSEKKACFKRISVSSALINIIFVTSVEIQWATEPEVTGKKKTCLCQGFYEITQWYFPQKASKEFWSNFAGLLSNSGC